MPIDLSALPKSVSDHVFGLSRAQFYIALYKNLPPNKIDQLHDITLGAINHDFPLEELPARVIAIIPPPLGKYLALDILGGDFLKMQGWYEEKIPELIRVNGGDPSDYEMLHSADTLIEEIIKTIPPELIPPRSHDHLVGKMRGFLTGALDRASLLASMMKSPKIGGWGWSNQIALPILDLLETRRVEVEKIGGRFTSAEEITAQQMRKKARASALSVSEETLELKQSAPEPPSELKQLTLESPSEDEKNDILPTVMTVTQKITDSIPVNASVNSKTPALPIGILPPPLPPADHLGALFLENLPPPYSSRFKLPPEPSHLHQMYEENIAPEIIADHHDGLDDLTATIDRLLQESELINAHKKSNNQSSAPLEYTEAELARNQEISNQVEEFVARIEQALEEEGVALAAESSEISEEKQESRAPVSPPQRTTFERALQSSDLLLEHELREIEQRKEELMSDLPETVIAISETLETLLDRISTEAGFETKDKHLIKRVKNILSARLRDLRGGEETSRLLMKIAEGKPEELSRALIEKLLILTEQSFLEFQRQVITRGLQRERTRAGQLREEALERKKEELEKTKQELDARFHRLTGKDLSLDFPLAVNVPELDGGNGSALASMPQRPIATASIVPAPETAVARAALRKSSDFTVALSPGSIAPNSKRGQKLTDMKFERTLVGPVEELKRLRLADFRRLSTDSEQAVHKILAKLELLSADGYDKRVAGIRAWRASPLMALYLAVTREALDRGISIGEILTERKAAAPEMLTVEECQAIRGLNAEIRY